MPNIISNLFSALIGFLPLILSILVAMYFYSRGASWIVVGGSFAAAILVLPMVFDQLTILKHGSASVDISTPATTSVSNSNNSY